VGALLSFAYSAREDVGVHERRLGDERRGIVHEFAGSEHRKLDRRHHKEDWGESILPATA
jgi:hypothetical protein